MNSLLYAKLAKTNLSKNRQNILPVSYTHLTLPTKLEV